MIEEQPALVILGWREWLSLPGLGIDRIKAKIDTGARTSALHAFYVEPYRSDGADWVKFGIHPVQRNKAIAVECRAEVKDRRIVTDSGGHREDRYVIETELLIGSIKWRAEITLTDRDTMNFRMLLGRTALKNRFLVDSGTSYRIGKKPRPGRSRSKSSL